MKTIETKGTVDVNHRLILDEPLSIDGPSKNFPKIIYRLKWEWKVI
jgi:hypothetical protein